MPTKKIRIKTLSLGVVIPDITFKLAKENAEMALFSPYDVERIYGKAFGDVAISECYEELVADERIRKKTINARDFFQTLAEIQFESGYPYHHVRGYGKPREPDCRTHQHEQPVLGDLAGQQRVSLRREPGLRGYRQGYLL